MSKPTPGPWEARLYLSDSDPPCKTPQVWTRDGMLICTIPAAARFDYANACLIAAAPDLLAACKVAKKYLEPDLVEPGRSVFWELVSAIRKAEGSE